MVNWARIFYRLSFFLKCNSINFSDTLWHFWFFGQILPFLRFLNVGWRCRCLLFCQRKCSFRHELRAFNISCRFIDLFLFGSFAFLLCRFPASDRHIFQLNRLDHRSMLFACFKHVLVLTRHGCFLDT